MDFKLSKCFCVPLIGYFISKLTVTFDFFFFICAYLLIPFSSFSKRHNHKANDEDLVTINNCLLFPPFKNSFSSSSPLYSGLISFPHISSSCVSLIWGKYSNRGRTDTLAWGASACIFALNLIEFGSETCYCIHFVK